MTVHDQPIPDRPELCRDDAAYVLGALAPAERLAFEEHLRTCPGCAASVQQLAGLPGLLATLSAEELGDSAPEPPAGLLSAVARRAARRRRRSWTVMGLAAAVFVAIAVLVTAVLLPRGGEPAQAGTQVSLRQVVPSPMNATLTLAGKPWGTQVVVHCSYGYGTDVGTSYALLVTDRAGHSEQAAAWRAGNAETATVVGATSIPRQDIASLAVRIAGGPTILRGAP